MFSLPKESDDNLFHDKIPWFDTTRISGCLFCLFRLSSCGAALFCLALILRWQAFERTCSQCHVKIDEFFATRQNFVLSTVTVSSTLYASANSRFHLLEITSYRDPKTNSSSAESDRLFVQIGSTEYSTQNPWVLELKNDVHYKFSTHKWGLNEAQKRIRSSTVIPSFYFPPIIDKSFQQRTNAVSSELSGNMQFLVGKCF